MFIPCVVETKENQQTHIIHGGQREAAAREVEAQVYPAVQATGAEDPAGQYDPVCCV